MRPEAAFGEWRSLLGDANVDVTPAALARAETATFATDQQVAGILRPASTAEVAACVRIARRHAVPLYPVSGGRNWGYGSRVPVSTGSVIIDLGRMNAISGYEEDLACVTLEPGVTQKQLFEYLEAQGGRLWMDPTASSSHASVVANGLERGHGFTPYADHVAKMCDLEVVLGTGELVNTGFRAHGSTRVASLDAFGVGPQLDGLFFQSNFGIVTRATVWLLRAPEHVELAVLRLPDNAAFAAALEALRPLRVEGAIHAGPRFSNVYRGLQYHGYPWQDVDGKTPLSLERALEIGARAGVAPWSGIVGLFGTAAAVAVQRERVRTAMAGIGELRCYSAQEIEALPPSAGAAQLRGQLAIFRGRVVGEGAAAALPYWRKRDREQTKGHATPEQDRCGTIWTTAVTPLRGADARQLVEAVTATALAAGFEPDISCMALRERTLNYHISITYDRDVPGDDERALKCSEKLRGELRDLGYPPYRLGITSMGAMAQTNPVYLALLHGMKQLCDPDNVIAPGRYLPSPSPSR